jgi:hypothetical protein
MNRKAVDQVWYLIRSCGIFGGSIGTGVGFLWVLRFPLQILIPSSVPYSLIILSAIIYGLDTDSDIV